MSLLADFTGIDIDIIGGAEHELYHFEKSLPDIDVWPFDKGSPLEININDSIERINGAILDDPFGTIGTIALLMVPGGAPAWAFAVNSGASTAYRGGSTEDVIKSMGLSYLGAQASDVVSNQVSQQITNSAVSEAFANSNLGAMGSGPLSRLNDTAVINAISAGAGKAAETLIHTEGDLSAAVDSFLTGSTFSGLSTILGGIDDSLAEGSFSSLSPGIKNAITTAALAVVKGEDVTEATLNGFIEGYVEGVIPTVQEYIGVDLLDGTQMSDEHITLITNALASSLDAAIAGGADPTDAFFASFREEANDRVKDWINSEEGLGVNKWFDDQLNNTEKLAAALNPYNEKKAQRAEQVVEYNRIAGKEKELFTAYEDATTEADKAAARQAVLDYRATDEFKSLTGIKTKIEQYEAELVPLYSAYNTAVDNMLSDIDEFGDEFKPISDLAAMTAAKTLRPTFDEDQYKEVMGLEEDDTAALHYLENQAIGDIEIAKSIAGEYQDVILKLQNGEIDELPEWVGSTKDIVPNAYGAPEGLAPLDGGLPPDIDFTVPQRPPSLASGRGGDPRDYGLTPEEYGEYLTEAGSSALTTFKDAYRNATSGLGEAFGFTAGGAGTLLNQTTENIIDAFGVDRSKAEELSYESLAIQYDPDLTDDEKVEKIANNVALATAANAKAEAEQGANITFFTNFTDPLKDTLLGWSESEAKKISPAMKIRQYNALPRPDTTWEQILSGQAKDRLGRPYGFGDPVATAMSGAQELPDLLVDVALLALTKNPAVLGGVVASTSMLEAGEAAADEIKAGLQAGYDSGALQQSPEFLDLVRLYDGDMDAAFEKLVDNSMGYAAASGVVGGLGDLVLAKIAGASGASTLLNNVPTALKPIVKTGAGGLSEGINEAVEQVPVNMAIINANFLSDDEVSILDGTPVAFLVGTSSGATATTAADFFQASLSTIKNTVKSVADGTYTAPDGSTFAPDQPNSDATDSAADQTLTSIVKYELYTGALNNLASWGAVPSNPADSNATEFVSTLSGLGFDTDTIVDIGNVAYNNDFVTKTEISDQIKLINPAFNPSEELSAQAYEQFGGYTPPVYGPTAAGDTESLDKLLENFIDPYYFDRDEVKKAAEDAGFVLTDEQADGYVQQVENEGDAVADLTDELGLTGAIVDNVVGNPAGVDADGNPTPATGLYAAIETATSDTLSQDDVSDIVSDLLAGILGSRGVPKITIDEVLNQSVLPPNEQNQDYDINKDGTVDSRDALELAKNPDLISEGKDSTGVFKDIDDVAKQVDTINDLIGRPATDDDVATGIFAALAGAENLSIDDVKSTVEGILNENGLNSKAQQDVQDIVDEALGSPAGVDENGDAVDPTGIYAELESLGAAGLSETAKTDVQDLIDTVIGNAAEGTGVLGAIEGLEDLSEDEVKTIVGGIVGSSEENTGLFGTIAGLNNLSDQDVKTALEGYVGTPAGVDANNNPVDPTGLYASLANLTETVGALNNISEDDVKTTVANALSKLENLSTEDVEAVVENIVGSEADGTGLFGAVGNLNDLSSEEVNNLITTELNKLENLSSDDVQAVVNDIIGSPAGVDVNGNPTAPTGMYASFAGIDDTLGGIESDLTNLSDVLGTPAEIGADGSVITDPTGVFANFADIDTRFDAIDTVTSNLTSIIGVAADLGVDSTGLYAYIDGAVQTLKDAGLTQEQVATTVTEIVGSPATDDTAATGVYAELDALGVDSDTIINTLGIPATDDAAGTGLFGYIDTATGKITEDISELSETVGDPAVLDEEGNVVKEATGVFADLATLEASGLTRDEAILQLATNLGLQTTTLTTAINDAEGRLTTELGDTETRIVELVKEYEAAGILRDEALDTAIGDVATDLGLTKETLLTGLGTTKTDILSALTETEGRLTTEIGDIEASLGNELDAIANYVGKPAREVTQADIDFVIDLVAQQNVSQELITQYDVTGDGVVDIDDQTLLEKRLQGDEDVTLADTSMFTDATGLYQQAQQDTQTTQDLITQLNAQLNTKIDDQTEQQNVNNLMQLLGQAEDIGGRRTTVTTPDPIGSITPYDFKTIFRDDAQASRYVSPFGGNQANVAQQALNPTSNIMSGGTLPGFNPTFAQGGQVEDENDMLLKMLGELE